MKLFFAFSAGAVSVVTLVTLTGLMSPTTSLPFTSSAAGDKSSHVTMLEQIALEKILENASPIFGKYINSQSTTSSWMKGYADHTPIVSMNIPGTHDTATWNYSETTQKSLAPILNLVSPRLEVEPTFYRCQQRPMIDMLNAGIRAFDLRYALDVTESYLVFWHGRALQSQTASVEDVLFAYYRWLSDHPSETVLLSLKFEGSSAVHNVDNAFVQQKIYAALTSPAAKEYVLQDKDRFGTLGEARGKIIVLRRFDLDLLPASYEADVPGVHFSPKKWENNGANITLIYNEFTGGKAYIQDYYHPRTSYGSGIEENIDVKYSATVNHLEFAAKADQDALIWSFASSTNTDNKTPNTPRLQALGDGEILGVNHRLHSYLKKMKGRRLGILMLDFFDEPESIVSLYLGLETSGDMLQ